MHCPSLVRFPQDAEDVVQEVFLRLYTAEKPLEGPEHLRR